jgi:hypothetical protein
VLAAFPVRPMLASSILSLTSTPWVANFFDDSNGHALCTVVQGRRDGSDCDHSTVAYNPSAELMCVPRFIFSTLAFRHSPACYAFFIRSELQPFFGVRASLRALAVAHDEHARAVLLHLDAGPEKAASTNAWPHSTVAHGSYPYSPVYSNCLWERVSAASNVSVVRDGKGKPAALELPNRARSWHGEVPEGKCSESSAFFPATNATIQILADAGQRGLIFNATLCSNALWDREAGRCDRNASSEDNVF